MGAEKECFQVIANKTGAFVGFLEGANGSSANPKEEVTFLTSTSCTRANGKIPVITFKHIGMWK